jgi:hypothetical protein
MPHNAEKTRKRRSHLKSDFSIGFAFSLLPYYKPSLISELRAPALCFRYPESPEQGIAAEQDNQYQEEEKQFGT